MLSTVDHPARCFPRHINLNDLVNSLLAAANKPLSVLPSFACAHWPCTAHYEQLKRHTHSCLGMATVSQQACVHGAGWEFFLTTGVGDSEVFFHSWKTGAPEVVVIDEDLTSLLPVAPPGQDL